MKQHPRDGTPVISEMDKLERSLDMMADGKLLVAKPEFGLRGIV